ncbi:hypothetical protein HanXRQr2_Chr14g0640241 [Helianthus annuus]|uniref:Uncharacterized protein n=1 Tax=Helianthus annuus TaxID=4232 RepID=A0A251SG64_HELAN|nr:hypothetical protein HanXRQr2_Chr14g0640241 [Helianthus annuus]
MPFWARTREATRRTYGIRINYLRVKENTMDKGITTHEYGIMGTRGSRTDEWNKVWRQIRDRVSNVGSSIRQVISPT